MICYWYCDRKTDQWNRIESVEIDPQIYRQLIFNKTAKEICEESLSNKCYEKTEYSYIKK